MNKFNCALGAASMSLAFLSVNSQIIDSFGSQKNLILKEVQIKSSPFGFKRANYLNEVFTANSLQSQISDMYIKNYGVGQLATVSMRGLGAENVSVLWAGIPVNSPLLGLYNLNLIPNSLIQDISYHSTGNRLTSGGSIQIGSPISSTHKLVVSSTAYLSELFTHKLEGNFNKGKSSFGIIQQITHGANRFHYRNQIDEIKQIENNSVKQINTQLFYTYRLKNWNVNSGFWYQNQDGAIPNSASMFSSTTTSLMDRNLRGFVGINTKKLDMKISYSNESQQYNDQSPFAFEPQANYKVEAIKGVLNYHTDLKFGKSSQLNYTLYPTKYRIHSTSISDPNSENIYEAIQQLDLKTELTDKFVFDLGIKSQWNSNFSNFLLPSFALTYQVNGNISSSIVADINARNPTMNDLFFNFYGNVNLRPETNYQIRNIWKYTSQNNYDKVQIIAEPYCIQSVDKINYVPDSNFRVFNIDKTTSYGFNSNIEWSHKINRANILRTIAGLNIIDSKDQLGNNMAYVPQVKNLIGLTWVREDFEVMLNSNYTSRRYANQANTSELKPYFVSNMKVTTKHHLKNSLLQVALGIDNLWNENYREIQDNFLPLRNYYMNMTFVLR